MRACFLYSLALCCLAAQPTAPRHTTIYYEPGRYGGWPANHGIWGWGNEIVVGFTEARYAPDQPGHVAGKETFWDRQARSLDGGATWKVEPRRTLTPAQGGPAAQHLSTGIDFLAPDLALQFRFGDQNHGPAWFYYSLDRCHTWKGPFTLPTFGRRAIAPRTDYQVLDKNSLLLFASASKDNGMEGRPFCARTRDGGVTWEFVSWIGPEPKGYAIMPSTVRLSPDVLFTAIRRKEERQAWIEAFRSPNNGLEWQYLGHITPSGNGSNPASLVRLRDGRICITYGYRGEPFSIRARLSGDNGKSWSKEIILRQDGTATDLGYTRSIQRPDGKIVTVYYFNAPAHAERTIEATIWDPGSASLQQQKQ